MMEFLSHLLSFLTIAGVPEDVHAAWLWMIPIAIAAVQMLQQQQAQKKQEEQFNQMYALQAQKDANQEARAKLASSYATAASNPNSEAFKNLASVYADIYNQNALAASKEYTRQQNRQMGRGLSARPERYDEARAAALNKAFHDAGLQSNAAAQQSLLNSSRAIAGIPGTSGDAQAMATAIQGIGQAAAAGNQTLGNLGQAFMNAYGSGNSGTNAALANQGSFNNPYTWEGQTYGSEMYGGAF